MAYTRSEMLEKILDNYASIYDIERMEDGGVLAATAFFHEHGTGYMLVKNAKMWEADRHEYSFIYSVPHLDAALAKRCIEEAFENGKTKIDPDASHMCSNIAAVFLCDTAEAEALEEIRKFKKSVSYKHGLNGWTEVITAAVLLEEDKIVTNGVGRPTGTFLKSILHPKKNSAWRRHVGKLFRR